MCSSRFHAVARQTILAPAVLRLPSDEPDADAAADKLNSERQAGAANQHIGHQAGSIRVSVALAIEVWHDAYIAFRWHRRKSMRANRPTVLLACAAFLGAAFATLPEPAHSQSKSSYCRGYAKDYARRNSRGPIAGGAIAGAIGGAVIGGILGGGRGAGTGAIIGAGTGAVAGGVARGNDYNSLYNRAYNNCMRN
jgi:hypothetical protein